MNKDSDYLAPISMADSCSSISSRHVEYLSASTIFSHRKCRTQPETASLTSRDDFSFLGIHLKFFYCDGVGSFLSAATAAIPDVLLVVVEEVIEVDGFEAGMGCLGRCWGL